MSKLNKMHEKLNPARIFESDTNFHYFLHAVWKCFRGVFRYVFSAVRFRIRAVGAKCGMPEYYGFYNGF